MTAPRAYITATSQQSRFHSATLDTASSEVDLAGVCVALGTEAEPEALEVLVDAELKLKEETRYALVGRNGSGKSTLLRALADRLIPGLPPSLRVHLVTQLDEDTSDSDSTEAEVGPSTVLQRVLDGHVERRDALREKKDLTRALDSDSPLESQRILDKVLLRRAEAELAERQRIAQRRSGARGKAARADEIAAEKEVEAVMARLDLGEADSQGQGDGKQAREGVVGRVTELLAEVQVTLDLLDDDGIEDRAREVLRGLGFSKRMIDAPFSSLSGGWRSRCRLATALLVPTDLLLLDEPSNFMDLSSVLWLERTLPTLTTYTTLLITSHDQILLDRLCTRTIALRSRSLVYFDGPPSLMLRTEAEARVVAAKTSSALDKRRAAVEASIVSAKRAAKEKGDDGKARQAKSRQRKLDDRWGLEKNAKGGRFKLNRDLGGYHASKRAGVEEVWTEQAVRIRLDGPEELKGGGGALVHVDKATIGWATGKREGKEMMRVVLRDVGMTVHPHSRIGLVGANGQGKSTLISLLLSSFPPSPLLHLPAAFRVTSPSTPAVHVHPTARIALFSQHTVDALSRPPTAALSALQHLQTTAQACGVPPPSDAEGRQFLGRVGLHGATAAEVPLGLLSGGQRVRVGLGVMMWRAPHLLVLDEITTHLDVQTIRALARALQAWQGAIVLVTHDRWFARAVIERRPIEDDDGNEPEPAPDAEDADAAREPGRTYLVDKGGVRLLERGMDEYEEVARKELKAALK